MPPTSRACAQPGRSPGSGCAAGSSYWCICGVALITLLGLGAAGTLALYPITYQRQECLEGANTGVAKAACQHQFDRRISRLQDTFGG